MKFQYKITGGKKLKKEVCKCSCFYWKRQCLGRAGKWFFFTFIFSHTGIKAIHQIYSFLGLG